MIKRTRRDRLPGLTIVFLCSEGLLTLQICSFQILPQQQATVCSYTTTPRWLMLDVIGFYFPLVGFVEFCTASTVITIIPMSTEQKKNLHTSINIYSLGLFKDTAPKHFTIIPTKYGAVTAFCFHFKGAMCKIWP